MGILHDTTTPTVLLSETIRFICHKLYARLDKIIILWILRYTGVGRFKINGLFFLKFRGFFDNDRGNLHYQTCAAGFALLNLPKGKSLGRSKPATNSSNEQAH